MRNTWFTAIEPQDRDFLLALGACTLAYGLVAWGLSFVPTPSRSSTDVASLPPRLAKLIMEAPPPPRVTLTPPAPAVTSSPPTASSSEKAPRKSTKPQAKTPPLEPAPLSEAEQQARAETALQEARLRLEAEAVARREQARSVARESGLLKALANTGGGGVGQGPAIDRVLGDATVLSNPALPPSGTAGAGAGLGEGSGQGLGSGSGGTRLSVEELVAGLKGTGTGEAVVLGGKASARVSSALTVEEELLAKRSDESIHKMLKTLDPWLKLKYHSALKDGQELGDFLSVHFTITAEGDVIDCQVRESRLGYPPLEDTILKRICLLKFAPLTHGIGEDIDATYTIDFARFT